MTLLEGDEDYEIAIGPGVKAGASHIKYNHKWGRQIYYGGRPLGGGETPAIRRGVSFFSIYLIKKVDINNHIEGGINITY